MSEELKPCPFSVCDGVAGVIGDGIYWVECEKCGCNSPEASTKEEAIKNWNTRATQTVDSDHQGVKYEN